MEPRRFLFALGAVALILAAPALAAAQSREAPASRDPRVKFRDGERYLRDLADGLEIPRDEICKELGRYDCNDDAFKIVLGGVDPYEIGVQQPLEHASLAGPIAYDRIALQACINRVNRDLANPAAAVLLKTPARQVRGTALPDRAWMNGTVDAIYDRVLRREATAAEQQRMADFYRTVARGRRDGPAAIQKDWVTLSCFSVASSLEAAFY